MQIYHGSEEIVKLPEIRKTLYTKDFSWGFYCTNNIIQAKRWASRKSNTGVVNVYEYTPDSTLNVLKFDNMNDEWLDFITKCRLGKVHDYDVVEGPMADDTIWDYVNDFVEGSISREAFWALAKFKYPTHQISFHTLKAINCLEWIRSENV